MLSSPVFENIQLHAVYFWAFPAVKKVIATVRPFLGLT